MIVPGRRCAQRSIVPENSVLEAQREAEVHEETLTQAAAVQDAPVEAAASVAPALPSPAIPSEDVPTAAKFGWRRWLAYALTGLVAASLLVALAGFCFESHVVARDAKRFPMRGQLVDVGGYRLHLYCTGAGSPTVVLSGGFTDTLEQWKEIQPEIARFARVCSFDRAGLGWSDAGPMPRSSGQIANELHTALTNAHIPGPYILVGHSFGGLDMRIFAGRHPDEVAGVVLIDSVNPYLFRWDLPGGFRSEARFWLYRHLAPFGITRVLGECRSGPNPCPEFVDTWHAMWEARILSAYQARDTNSFGNVPLIVIARDPLHYLMPVDKPERPEWELQFARAQMQLTRLSSDASFVLALNTGHQIPRDKPRLVVSAVEKLVSQARAASPKTNSPTTIEVASALR
jgi:pimeloyl-ACP methyl ester carboxylesterase